MMKTWYEWNIDKRITHEKGGFTANIVTWIICAVAATLFASFEIWLGTATMIICCSLLGSSAAHHRSNALLLIHLRKEREGKDGV